MPCPEPGTPRIPSGVGLWPSGPLEARNSTGANVFTKYGRREYQPANSWASHRQKQQTVTAYVVIRRRYHALENRPRALFPTFATGGPGLSAPKDCFAMLFFQAAPEKDRRETGVILASSLTNARYQEARRP